MKKKLAPIVIFGGTFNPIHQGHIQHALAVCDELNIKSLRFMPNSQPPHKEQPTANAQQRAEMIELAIISHPRLTLDTQELQRDGNSYTVDTLQTIRNGMHQDQSLIFILGTDSLQNLSQWHRWKELLTVCHLGVIPRIEGTEAPKQSSATQEDLLSWISTHSDSCSQTLLDNACGFIYCFSNSLMQVSSTEIRYNIAQEKSHSLLDDKVSKYITKHNLYRNFNYHSSI